MHSRGSGGAQTQTIGWRTDCWTFMTSSTRRSGTGLRMSSPTPTPGCRRPSCWRVRASAEMIDALRRPRFFGLAHGRCSVARRRDTLCPSARRAFTARVENRPDSISNRSKPRVRCPPACRLTGSTGDDRWLREAWSAFNWFLGDNDLQLPLYDSSHGRMPRRFASRPGQRESGSGIHSLFPDGTSGDELRKTDIQIPEKLYGQVHDCSCKPLEIQ